MVRSTQRGDIAKLKPILNKTTPDGILKTARIEGGILILGGVGGTNVGDSFARAGAELGYRTTLLNQAHAMSTVRIVQSLAWRFAGRRPLYLNSFSQEVVAKVSLSNIKALIATGTAPLNRSALSKLRARNIFCINYSTDDPWNPTQRAGWFLDSLPRYDVVFTPRRSNIPDFRKLGCVKVRYLPFGYAPDLFAPPPPPTGTEPMRDILFVGGADQDRVAFFAAFIGEGLRVGFAGDYWDRFPPTCAFALGRAGPKELCHMTAAAAVNLCLVRRANRDGHVMRSFEIPAIGGFMIAEDTREHRDIFGPEGQCVLYFTSPQDAAQKTRWALNHPEERSRMARAAHELVTKGRHTYADRLKEMLTVSGLK